MSIARFGLTVATFDFHKATVGFETAIWKLQLTILGAICKQKLAMWTLLAISSSKRLPVLHIVASWGRSCGVPPWFGHLP